MSNRLQLFPPFDLLWKDRDPFAMARELDGRIFRAVKNRKTLRFELDGKGYFLKYHGATPWSEIFKNWFSFKQPVLGAGGEFDALTLLHKIGVPTMTAAAFGERGSGIAHRESFLVTEELADMISLEDLCRKWVNDPPPVREKRSIIHQLARSVGAMHRAGLNHRDCYLCHFLRSKEGNLFVIDLHRAQIRPSVPHHYRVKDLGGLLFSAMDIGLTRSDCRRFVETYSRRRWLEEIRANRAFWLEVKRCAEKLYRKEFRRPAPELK